MSRAPADLTERLFERAGPLLDRLRAAGMEPSQRLATALVYGIKTDTLFLERGSNLADLSAFNFLYPIANKAPPASDKT